MKIDREPLWDTEGNPLAVYVEAVMIDREILLHPLGSWTTDWASERGRVAWSVARQHYESAGRRGSYVYGLSIEDQPWNRQVVVSWLETPAMR